MFFMVTPPEETVVRAWYRGLEFGRFKSVDDLLSHNIEAYTGMPELFFTWALSTDREVQYEFLDNSVAKDQRPKTIAFGRNGRLFILDVLGLLNVSRYRRVRVQAKSPAEVFPDEGEMTVANNLQFLRDCIERMPEVTLIDPKTVRAYARFVAGALVWLDEAWLADSEGSELRNAVSHWIPSSNSSATRAESAPPGMTTDLRDDPSAVEIAENTLGDWARY
jgi:hypothetical protein